MVEAKKGDKVQILSSYRARGFRLAEGEKLEAAFGSFDRSAHAPLLIQMEKGAIGTALTDSENGQIYVESSNDGSLFACILLDDTYKVE